MPELPEVENFRRLLLPLVSTSEKLAIECPLSNPPRSFLTPEQIESLNGNCHVKDVLRKGKLICMVLNCVAKVENQDCVYLFLHMGMTGRISTPLYTPALESLNDTDYPAPHTFLTFKTGSAEASFSDPRKFGSITLSTTLGDFDKLAPDAQTLSNPKGFVNQSTGIKAILLNQKRVVSGVGNWIADEVLYQSQLHPEQTHLTLDEANVLQEKLQSVLSTALTCLENREEYPKDWLFHCRWAKRSANSGNKVSDSKGRNIVYLKAGGRTSAIVPSIQAKRSQQAKGKKRKNYASEQKKKDAVEENEQDAEKKKKKKKKPIHKKRKRSDSKTAKMEENVQDAEEKPKKRKRPESKRAKREAKKSSKRATENAPRRSARLSS